MEQRCLSLDSAPASLELPGSLTLSEIMTICTVFHLSGYGHLTKRMFGKLFADKGCVSQKIFHALWDEGIQLVIKQKKNAKKKECLVLLADKILLRKRAVIESVNDFLKNICQIEHSRHRICYKFVVNLVSGLAAYTFLPKRPSSLEGLDCQAE